jgi:hypothetical protein
MQTEDAESSTANQNTAEKNEKKRKRREKDREKLKEKKVWQCEVDWFMTKFPCPIL